MIDLQEYQFEILPSEDAAGGVGFGIGMPVSVDDDGFQPGGNSWATQDGTNQQRGTTAFGRDVLNGPEWGWDLHVDQSDIASARAALGEIATAWRAKQIRDTPGAVLPVRYRLGDEVRRIYGRPRNFDAPPDNRIMGGYVPVTTSFKCVDAFTYDDEASSTVLSGLVDGDSGGGFVFPVIFPVTTLPPVNARPGAITVLGDEAAYPIVRFDGPCDSPWLLVDGGAWRIDLDITLTAGEYAVVDTRPWVNTVVKNGSQGIGGALGRRQWMADMRLEPGQHSLAFGAASGTNPTCAVSWRSTWNSI